MSEFPLMFRLRQQFPRPRVNDIGAKVDEQFTQLGLTERIRPGQSVAITAGSRGISNIAEILAAVAGYVRRCGANPFLIPAMGSHGGATADGQKSVLARLGINEATVGCEIRAGMETVVVDHSRWGFPIHFDQQAHRADHVLVCNRVKLHTDYAGTYQSGLVKMMLIGLGKYQGAKAYHSATLEYGLDEVVRDVAPRILATGKITAGLAILENGYDETADLVAMWSDEFLQREPELLQQAASSLARLPFDRIDVLVIDEIGKNISGTGMDTNVIGRKFNDHEAVRGETPQVRRIVVRGLTPATDGNAVGIGIAEFCRSQVVESMNHRSTFINGITSGHVSAAMIPIHFPTDREVLEQALQTIGLTPPAEARMVWIRNTLRLTEFACSAAYWDQADRLDHVERIGTYQPLPLDMHGNLPPTVDDWKP